MTNRNLLVVPDLILEESLASYIARLCQMHSVHPRVLVKGLSIERKDDYDLDIRHCDLVQVTRGTRLTDKQIYFLTTRFGRVRRQNLTELFLNVDRGKGYYKYCPRCLETDLVPYWRWTWRLKHFEICPKHKIKLLDSCQSCGRRINIKKNLDKRYYGIDDGMILEFCGQCRAALSEVAGTTIQSKRLSRYLNLQNKITGACLRGAFKVKGFNDNFPLKYLPIFLILSLCESGDYTASKMWRKYESALKEMRLGRFRETGYLVDLPMTGNIPQNYSALFDLYSFGLKKHWLRSVGEA